MKISDNLRELFHTGIIHPTHTVGSGKWTHYYTYREFINNRGVIDTLAQRGLLPKIHYTIGNDAPKKGQLGYYIKLTEKGKSKLAKEISLS